MIPTGGSKVKGYIALAVLLFFVASNPTAAADVARTLGMAFVAVVDGFGVMASTLNGGGQ